MLRGGHLNRKEGGGDVADSLEGQSERERERESVNVIVVVIVSVFNSRVEKGPQRLKYYLK